MKITGKLCLVALLVALASAQLFRGGVLTNLEVGQFNVFPSATLQEEKFVYPLPRNNPFSSTTQDFLITTGIVSNNLSPY